MAAFGAKDFLRTQERAWLRDALPLFEEKLRDLKRGHACQLTIANERPFNKSQGYVCGSGTWNRVEMLANVFRERGWHVQTSNSTSFGAYFLTFTHRPTAWEHINNPSV